MSDFEFLPMEVRPRHYELCVRPRLDDNSFSFEGFLVAHLEVLSPVSKIVCNSLDLNIDNVFVDSLDNAELDKKSLSMDVSRETLTIRLDQPLRMGSTKLFIQFNGILNDKMKGFYRSSFEHENERHWMASTQFEATSARMCFPCWDEPSLKATFEVAIICNEKYTALANMPEKKDVECRDLREFLQKCCKIEEQEKITFYQRTPLMSTYLLAVVIGEMEYIEGRTNDDILVRIFAPLGKGDQCEFSLNVTIKSLEFYTNFFDIQCPLPKVDCVSVPDFLFGAMENWGLVTYRESCLLIDAQNSSKMAKQSVALIVAHEIAHHWFGNLVTMNWWTDLWLNEGFASFMMYLATDKILPEYEVWLAYVANTVTYALQADALGSSHPIEVEVHHPNQIDQIFDAISYQKGSTVIRMLYTWLGESAFRAGMKSYLSRFSFSNATTSDLWQNLAQASGKPVAQVMSTWTKQMGFPLITIEEKEPKIFNLRQEKFAYLPLNKREEREALWKIPIIVETKSGKKEFLMTEREMQIVLDQDSKTDYVKFNSGFFGYYRVLQSSCMLASLTSNMSRLDEKDRLNVLNDLFALAKSGHLATTTAMETSMKFAKEERSYPVWVSILGFVSSLSNIIEEDDSTNFEMFVQKLLVDIFVHLGFDSDPDETHTTSLLRSRIIAALAEAGHEDVINESRSRFENKDDLNTNIKDAVYTAIMTKGKEKEVSMFIELYKNSNSSEEKNRLARAMTNVQHGDSVKKILEFAVSDDVKNQDAPNIIGMMRSRHNSKLAWQFVKDNIEQFKSKFGTSNLMGRMLAVPSAITDAKEDVENFFKQHELNKSMKMITDNVLEQIEINQQWRKREKDNIAKFLKNIN